MVCTADNDKRRRTLQESVWEAIEMSKKVYVVHCVDTEGPLYESLDATFIAIQ